MVERQTDYTIAEGYTLPSEGKIYTEKTISTARMPQKALPE
jgi:hypothetical protein